MAGDAGVGAAVGAALSHGGRCGLSLSVEAGRCRRVEETVVHDADKQDQHLASAVPFEIGQHVVELAERSRALDRISWIGPRKGPGRT